MTDNPRWMEGISQPEPLPKTLSSPDERLLEGVSRAPLARRIVLGTALAILMLAPVAADLSRNVADGRMMRIEQAAAESRDVNQLGNRVAGQYAQGLALLQSTARDVETLPASPSLFPDKIGELQTRANSAIAFFSAAEAGSDALLSSTPPAMTREMQQDIFIDGRNDLIAFYAGVGERVRSAYAKASGQPAHDSDGMKEPLAAIEARESRLRTWLADFQDSERRRLSHIQDARN